MKEYLTSCFISADWSKDPKNRSVYLADLQERHIRKAEPSESSWDLTALLDLAEYRARDGSAMIGIDVVLGVPEGYWQLVLQEHRRQPETFVDWLAHLSDSEGFFETVFKPDEWQVDKPWFKVARGHGGRTLFTGKVDGNMLRRIDEATRANPVFAVAGIPGTVGGGTRELWRELIPRLEGARNFAVWPFEGDLVSLLASRGVVLCEIYPALAYAAAVAEALPTERKASAKTNALWRANVCNRLAQAAWVHSNGVDLGDLDPVRANEDDFDAHVTAAAVLRCILEHRALAQQEWIDEKTEGSMLLAGLVDLGRAIAGSTRTAVEFVSRKERSVLSSKPRPRKLTKHLPEKNYPCPISGCEKVFVGSRSGWDAHVVSPRTHRDWRSDIDKPEERRQAFREEFHEWFEPQMPSGHVQPAQH